MSIHPNRVLARIIEQVEQSDWPPLAPKIHSLANGREWIRVYEAPDLERYATSFHFWVHALRDELAARGRGEDLMGVAGHALCRNLTVSEWSAEIGEHGFAADTVRDDVEIYRMQADECRRSSVARNGDSLIAYFWGHGFGESWRRKGAK